ncbi:MAG: diguanylate cyclase domain-containing protein, partial [Gaiella sp.]
MPVAKRAALAAVVAVAAAGAHWFLEPFVDVPILQGVVPWWTMLVLFGSAELYVLTARGRAEVAALAPQDGIFAIGLFVLDPVGLVAAQLVGAIVAFVLLGALDHRATVRRLAALGLGATVALAVFQGAIELFDPTGPFAWLTALCAVVAGLLTRETATATMQWSGRASWLDSIASGGGARLAAGVASGSVGVVAVELLRYDTAAALLLLVPIVASARALRVYTTEHAQLVHLKSLDESMRAVHRAPDREAGVDELLTATHSLLGTDVAWLVLFENRGASTLVAWYTPEESSRLHSRDLSKSQGEACGLIAASPGAVPMARGRTTGVLLGLLADLRLAEAIATPVRGESGVLGVLVVGSRGVSRNALDEGRILALETYADHAAILLENDQLEQSVYDLEQLKDQLRHQAFHDALTGLPNRSLFTTRVAEALAGSDEETAVLFLDLDDFKLINDSFGHHAGDELLVAVASRVRGVVRATDMPARLGGDEFAVLAGDGGSSDAEHIAGRLVRTLEAPFTIDGREMSVHASVGFAVGRPGVTTAD